MISVLPNVGSFEYVSDWNPLDASCTHPSKRVVTIFLAKGDKILVLQRARKDAQHKLWGIPGGKLDQGEHPITGLLRELHEETKIQINPGSIELLDTAMSETPCDGQYGLYLYYAKITSDTPVFINYEEHCGYRWVSMEEFESMDLLTAQREAYLWVKEKLQSSLSK